MGANACHGPLVQDDDLVGMADGAHTLGNDEDGGVFGFCGQGLS